jgi:hypothetical protein
MARIPWQEVEQIPDHIRLPTLGEYAANDDGMLRVEWSILAARAHLTTRQHSCFFFYHVHGVGISRIADLLGLDEYTIRAHLQAAYSRLSQVPNPGLLTVLIECFGFGDVMGAMHDPDNGRRRPDPAARTLRRRR